MRYKTFSSYTKFLPALSSCQQQRTSNAVPYNLELNALPLSKVQVLGKLLINTKNNNGPRTLLCGINILNKSKLDEICSSEFFMY